MQSSLSFRCLAIFGFALWGLGVAAGAQQQPITILSIVFEGNRDIASSQLKRALRFLREGGTYHPEAFGYEMEQLKQFCVDQGYLEASLGEPKPEMAPAGERGAGIIIRIPVSEGPRFTLGEVFVKGADVFPGTTLRNLCPAKKGEPYQRPAMGEWRDKVAEGYGEMGYIRFRSVLQEAIKDAGHVVDVTLECQEGKVYTVSKVSVTGDEDTAAADFKKHILIGEGGTYNPAMISLTVQFLNQMGIWRPISPANVEVRIDDVRVTVEIVFHLTRIKKPQSK
jgi:outer membrane protein insertion porin family